MRRYKPLVVAAGSAGFLAALAALQALAPEDPYVQAIAAIGKLLVSFLAGAGE